MSHSTFDGQDGSGPFAAEPCSASGAAKLSALEETLGHFVHDIRNLLSIVSGCSDLAQAEHLPAERQRLYLAAVKDGATRAAALSSDMLAMIRKEDTVSKLFDAAERTHGLGRLIRQLVGGQVALDVRLSPHACLVKGSPEQFDAAVINLAVNARDAIPACGKVGIAVEHHGTYAEVRIEDDGVGIPSNEAERIFEPFFTTKAGHGTGLGLAQVARFARSTGGEVGVRTCVGKGTAISLFLPISGQLGLEQGVGSCCVIEGEVRRTAIEP